MTNRPASGSSTVDTLSYTSLLSLSNRRFFSPVLIATRSMNVFGPTCSGFLSFSVPW